LPRDLLGNQARQAAAWIAQRTSIAPQVAIVLGSGLGNLSSDLEQPRWFDFSEIPFLVRATALGHAGRLGLGTIGCTPVLVLDGRLHAYEGYLRTQATFPIRIMHALGARQVVLTCASGGLNPAFRPSDLMVITGHLNLLRWAGGPADVAVPPTLAGRCRGQRVYYGQLIALGKRVAARQGIVLHPGVYAAMTGPNYETRAEYRWLRRMGADAVGMSTVAEASLAARLGMRVLAVAVIANICHPDRLAATAGAQVLATAARAGPRLRQLLLGILSREE
jgi:purine-nucleoside phosphorylase